MNYKRLQVIAETYLSIFGSCSSKELAKFIKIKNLGETSWIEVQQTLEFSMKNGEYMFDYIGDGTFKKHDK